MIKYCVSFAFALLIMASGCSISSKDIKETIVLLKKRHHIKIVNNSNRSILYYMWWKEYPAEADSVPGEMFQEYPIMHHPMAGQVNPYKSTRFYGGRRTFPLYDYLQHQYNNFLFFDYDSIQKYGWETVWKTQKGFLESQIITIEYLEKHKWKICYPAPSETKHL